MSILITGGAGFIGSYLAKALHTLGREVVLMDNFDDYYDPRIKFKRVAALPELTFWDFISTYEEITGYEAIKVDKPSPKTEPLITYCDNTLARRLLGFDPNTTLRSGLAQTWTWYQSEGHRG